MEPRSARDLTVLGVRSANGGGRRMLYILSMKIAMRQKENLSVGCLRFEDEILECAEDSGEGNAECSVFKSASVQRTWF
jgi:hypothetical protein